MSDRLEDQIRTYTEALYATATPVDQLVPTHEVDGEPETPIRVTVGPPRRAAGRPISGPAIAVLAAIAVFVAALPIVLFSLLQDSDRDDVPPAATTVQPPSLTTAPPAPTTVPPAETTPAPEPGNVFRGVWVGDDPADGSLNTLTVEVASVVYEETGVSACRNDFGEFVAGSITAFPTIEGNRLTFTGTFFCELADGPTAHPFFDGLEWVATYDPATDTITFAADPNTILRRVD